MLKSAFLAFMMSEEIARARITNILTQRKNNLSALERTIIRIHEDCKGFLKRNKDIIIARADKGGSTVAMYRRNIWKR